MKKTLLALAAFAAVAVQAQTAANPNNIQEVQLMAQTTSGPNATPNASSPANDKADGTFLGLKMPKFNGPIGYPGNTWGTMVYAAKQNDLDTSPKWRIEGIVEQGVDWFRFGDGSWKFNTYGAVEYVVNSNDNSWTPVVGMKVNKRFGNGSLDLGTRYKYGNTFLSPQGSFVGGQKRTSRIEVYATYWFDWNLKQGE